MSLTAEQIDARLKGLGGSDIGAIIGVNNYASAHDVYNEKRGLVPPFAGNQFTDYGNRLERVILDWYVEKTGTKISIPLPNCEAVVHPKHEFMRGLPDAVVNNEDGEPIGIIEAKTAHWRTADQWGEAGTDDVPDSYLVQCAWYMAILDVMWCDLVVLLDREFRTYRIPRDMSLERRLIELGRDFWENHVVPGVPPEIDGSDGCAHRLAIYKANDGQVDSTKEMDSKAMELFGVSNQIKALTDQRSLLKNELAAMLGADGKKIKGAFGSAYWTDPKPQNKTDWESVCRALNASPDLIDEHTKPVTRKPSFQARFKKGLEQ